MPKDSLTPRDDAPEPDFLAHEEAAAAQAELVNLLTDGVEAIEHLCFLKEREMLERGTLKLDDCRYQDAGDDA